MRAPSPLPFSQLTTRLFAGIAIAILAGMGAIFFEQTSIRVVAGSFLYFLLPGYFLMLALLPKQDLVEQLVIAVASSTTLSTFTLLLVMLFVPGVLTTQQVWSALSILTLITLCAALYTALQQGKHTTTNRTKPIDAIPRGWWLVFILILLLAATLRTANLNHSELQDDEIDITSVSVRILRGEDQVVFQDRRGPAQTVITAAAYAMGESPSEWILRLPAVIAAITMVAAMVVLASTMFNRWLGLLAGLLLSLEGFVFAYGRIVQMQSTLMMMMVVTVLCFYQLYRSPTKKEAIIYQLLGTLFFGFGILAHYEMVLLAPVLFYLYLAKYGRAFWQRDKVGLLLSIGLLLLTTGAFYVAFILNPAFGETYSYYRNDIVGDLGGDIGQLSSQDTVKQYLLVALFYNSIYFFAALYIGAAITLFVQLRHHFHKIPRPIFISGALALLFVAAIAMVFLDGGTRNTLLFASTLIIGALCIISPRLPLAIRITSLWFVIYFVPYIFVLEEVHIHYYAFSPPLAILAAWGWHWLYQRSASRHPQATASVHRWAWLGTAVLITALSSYYMILVFVRPMPEYALNFPTNRAALFPAPYAIRHGEAFGFQHRSGWRTIAWLYRTGVLRGSFETNELWLKPQWYTQWQNAGEMPRYYLVADLPHRLQASPWPTPFEPQDYHLWGVVTVQGQPRLHIYERNSFAPPTQVSYWADEEMAAKLDAAQKVTELYRAERYQADREFYAQAAQQLASQPDTPLLFYAPEQVALFSLYDQSARQYIMPAIESASDTQAQAEVLRQINAQASTLNAIYWGIDDLPSAANLHTWLNQQLFPITDEWIGNLRLVAYDVPNTTPATTPATGQQQPNVKLGEAIELASYSIQHAGNLHLSLDWRALAPITQDYKVFVHLLDGNNSIVSQQDGEPVGGQRPTSSWMVAPSNANESSTLIRDNRAILIPPELKDLAGYQLAIGMYDPQTGERLPMTSPDGSRLPDDMLRIILE